MGSFTSLTHSSNPFQILLSLFLLFIGRSFPQLNFEWYRQKLLAGRLKENSQIFNEVFYLPLYLPLCLVALCQSFDVFLLFKPAHYQLSCAAPYCAAMHWLLRFVTFTFFDVFVLCTIRFVMQYVLWRCTSCNVYVLKFLRFVFLLSVQLRLVTYTYVNV